MDTITQRAILLDSYDRTTAWLSVLRDNLVTIEDDFERRINWGVRYAYDAMLDTAIGIETSLDRIGWDQPVRPVHPRDRLAVA